MTCAICVDLETTTTKLPEVDRPTPIPYHPDNRIVSAHWTLIQDGKIGESKRAIFYHVERPHPDPPDELLADLAKADILVAHNAKFDVSYLLEAGFELPKAIHCTMLAEYVLARGQRVGLSLADTAERRGVSLKKGELIEELFDGGKGIGFHEMPLETVISYADQDVLSTAEVYLDQMLDYDRDENKGLKPVLRLMNENLEFIVEIERNGIKIDPVALNEVHRQFEAEKKDLIKSLEEIAAEAVGDFPFNLGSGIDITRIVYGRTVTNRDKHKEVFNIGTDFRGRALHPPRMTDAEFARAVRTTTTRVEKVQAQHCVTCKGKGQVYKTKKDGTPYARSNKCTICEARGYLLINTGKKAGLGLNPEGPSFAAINGFKVDKNTIKRLIYQAQQRDNLRAVEFLTKYARLNAVETYLDSFVAGFRKFTMPDGILHANFNQAVTATGRLSSSNPNMQNQPKDKKFPIRKAIVSRFPGGLIAEADFSGLEFRCAGDLSRDPQIIDDVLNGKDIHKQTASIIHQIPPEEVTKDQRQEAKAHSFAPLFGSRGGDEAGHIKAYYDEFFNVYPGMGEKHREWMSSALTTGIVRVPSGREYHFPNVKRLGNGRVTNATMIVNWPVQGFATGDLVPLACIRALRAFKKFKLRSLLILTVHDSVAVDVYPGELEIVCQALHWAMTGVPVEVKKRWNYEMALPLDIEISAGPNWGSTEEVKLDKILEKAA